MLLSDIKKLSKKKAKAKNVDSPVSKNVYGGVGLQDHTAPKGGSASESGSAAGAGSGGDGGGE